MPFIRKSKLDALIRAGNVCSNVCYNLAQRKDFIEADKATMLDAYRTWDAARTVARGHHQLPTPPSGAKR